jgi:hypothetical protein
MTRTAWVGRHGSDGMGRTAWVHGGRETVIEDNVWPFRVRRGYVLHPPVRRSPHEPDVRMRAVRVEREQQVPRTRQTCRDAGNRTDGEDGAPRGDPAAHGTARSDGFWRACHARNSGTRSRVLTGNPI